MTLAAVLEYQTYARRTAALALLVCLAAAIAYSALLLLTVERAALKQQYQAQAQAANASLASLESQYLAESSALTPEKAAQLGLVPVPVSRIAYQQPASPVLSMRQ
ncbi:MAG: hypothetical protein ACREGH_02000 [Minisyncoccia bacterium]